MQLLTTEYVKSRFITHCLLENTLEDNSMRRNDNPYRDVDS